MGVPWGIGSISVRIPMPRPFPMSRTAPTYPSEPLLAWTSRLDGLLWVDRFDVLYPFVYAANDRPIGVDFDGILKADLEDCDERTQRARCLEAFESVLDVLVEAGTRHRNHPTFAIDGKVDHGAFFLDSVRATPDRLIPQCTAKFQVWLEGS